MPSYLRIVEHLLEPPPASSQEFGSINLNQVSCQPTSMTVQISLLVNAQQRSTRRCHLSLSTTTRGTIYTAPSARLALPRHLQSCKRSARYRQPCTSHHSHTSITTPFYSSSQQKGYQTADSQSLVSSRLVLLAQQSSVHQPNQPPSQRSLFFRQNTMLINFTVAHQTPSSQNCPRACEIFLLA